MTTIITSDGKHRADVLDSETAIPLLKECVATETDDIEKANCANKLGLIYSEGYFGKVDLKKAKSYYKIAYDLEPSNLEYVHNLGLVYYNRGLYNKAVPLLEECVRTKNSNLSIYGRVTCASKLGHIYVEGKLGEVNLKKAFDNYKFANKFEPENEIFAGNLAYCANSLGVAYQTGNDKKVNLDIALKYYKIAYNAQSDNVIYIKYLADVYYKLGNSGKAKMLLKKCLESGVDTETSNWDKANCANILGTIYNSEELFDKAVENINKAYELYQDPVFIHNLASVYYAAGDCQKAELFFNKCAEEDLTDHFTKDLKEVCISGTEACNAIKDDL